MRKLTLLLSAFALALSCYSLHNANKTYNTLNNQRKSHTVIGEYPNAVLVHASPHYFEWKERKYVEYYTNVNGKQYVVTALIEP